MSPEHLRTAGVSSGQPFKDTSKGVIAAVLLCRGDVILPEHLPPKMGMVASGSTPSSGGQGRLSQVERATILATLEECNGNRTHAAKKLGISRRALIYKLRIIEAE